MARLPPGFAECRGVSALVANVGLIVAALDLKEVQLLRGAMRAADIASGRPQAVSGLGPAPTPPPSQLVREPQFEPRRVIYPEPRYEPRRVIHPTPLKEYLPPVRVKADVQVEAKVVSPPARPEMEGPLAPPWQQPVWQMQVAPPPKVKMVRYHTDIKNKGSLLDCFI